MNKQQMVLHNFSGGKQKETPTCFRLSKGDCQDASVGGQYGSYWSYKSRACCRSSGSRSAPPLLFLSWECIAKESLKPLEQWEVQVRQYKCKQLTSYVLIWWFSMKYTQYQLYPHQEKEDITKQGFSSLCCSFVWVLLFTYTQDGHL